MGNVYEGAPKFQHQEHSVWWWLLVVSHVYIALLGIGKSIQFCFTLYETAKASKGNAKEGVGMLGLFKRLMKTMHDTAKEMAIPILTGIILYWPLEESTI